MTSFCGKIWVVGGCDAWNPLSSVEIYDPATNAWKPGPPMGTPRRGCGLVVSKGLLYVVGGSDGTQSLCTTEVYDPRMNLWTSGPNMTTCRANVSCAVVAGRIWAVGGFSGKAFLNTIEYLDTDRDEWTTYIRAGDEPFGPETNADAVTNEEEKTEVKSEIKGEVTEVVMESPAAASKEEKRTVFKVQKVLHFSPSTENTASDCSTESESSPVSSVCGD